MRVGSWLTAKKHSNASTLSLNSLDEPQNLEDAMRAATQIMNDDVDAAEAGLKRGNSAFHKVSDAFLTRQGQGSFNVPKMMMMKNPNEYADKLVKLGKGVVTFMRATLGFEQETMREASEFLGDAEATASADLRRAQHEATSFHSSIYPPGSEYALCNAEAQLMGAIVGLLNESLTESIKGFYKLRKAYMSLDGILEAEVKYMRGKTDSMSARSSIEADRSTMPGSFHDETQHLQHSKLRNALSPDEAYVRHEGGVGDDSDVFVDAVEDVHTTSTLTTYTGQIDEEEVHENFAAFTLEITESHASRNRPVVDHDPDSEFFSNPIDVFIHSGANLCFGVLLLMISMIPPAFGKLLYIIGFKGDRERGLQMLWQSSKFHNINGALAGLILLGFYNNLIGTCDILPDSDSGYLDGYPVKMCQELLSDMRRRYPKSHLWMLEEARMEAADKKLEHAIEMLDEDMSSPLKQVEALAMFEKALDSMYCHKYSLCAESFIKCVALNNWSHALYYYIAGAAHVELYRQYKIIEPTRAKEHAAKANENLQMVPSLTGKKRFMARPLPFDVFVSRKIQKWQHRSSDWGIPFVDAIGVSPLAEMIYFWNGFKRMNSTHLNATLDQLSWSLNESANPTWKSEALDERAIHSVLRAVIFRHLGEVEKSQDILKHEVLIHDRNLFKGHLRDDWTCPSAHYEMAVVCWLKREQPDKGKECAEWLDKAARWESYDLDARIGLKVTTAQDTLRKYNLMV